MTKRKQSAKQDRFQVDIQKVGHNLAVINPIGDITAFSEKSVIDAYEQISQAGINKIILNLRGDDFIDTASMAICIRVVTEARKRKQRLMIATPSHHLQKIFRMTGVTQHADVYTSLDEALASAKSQAETDETS